jgi:hypothetical protein
VANPKLSTFADPFAAAAINTTLWSNITAGATTLDTVNDLVALAQPTASGTNNTFGTNTLFDATSSQIYAEVGAVPNGAGGTKTIFKVLLDGSNSVAIRLEAGAFKLTLQTAGTTVTTTLPTYDPNAHGWWRLREASGTWYADASADGFTWTTLTSSTYSWAATGVTFVFQTGASGTEAAGNAATIQHVNTMLGGPFNINWPTVEDAWGAYWNANAGDSPLDRYVEISDRTRGTVNTSRGRQYETDQVRSGEASLALGNKDAALDPINASGPWYGHIQPYQPYRRRAQWPPTRNLLDQVHATGGDLGGYSAGTIPSGSAGADIFSSTDSTGGSFVATATAWAGGMVMQFSVPNGSASASRACHTPRFSVIPGQAYTVQLRVRDVTASTSLSVQAFFGWYTAGGGGTPTSFTYGSSASLTGSTTAGWTTITVTATAPSNAAGIDVGVALAASAAATCSLQVDGWQLEKGSTASAWTCPGLWNPVYAGFMERWPSSWDMKGTYGLVSPSAVDAFSLLSQKQLSDPLTQEINNNNPRFLFKLDDPSSSTSVADATGTYPAAQLGVSKYGAGSLKFGNAITSTGTGGTYTGSTGTVARIANSNPGTNLITGGATFIKLTNSGISGPADPTVWTRMAAFRYTGPAPTDRAIFWSAMDKNRSGGGPSGSQLHFVITSGSVLQLWMYGPTGASVAFAFDATNNVVDGDWHLATAAYSQSAQTMQLTLDGVTTFYTSVATNLTPSGMDGDNLGGFVDITIGGGTTYNYQGDLSFCAEFPTALSATAQQNLYGAWKSSFSGDSTSTRYARILRYSGYTGPSSVQTGLTTSMGPAAIDGQDTISALQAVVDTEGGAHYVDRAGNVVFKSRSARYNATTPICTFGENAASGEWPYEDVTLDYDSTHLSNQVTVTQEGTSQAFYAQDSTSISNFFPRTMSRTVNSSSALECQDAASYLLSRYKNPATRVSSIKLHPSANPAMWPVCLALELGTRVRVMRRAPNVPATQVECFVENIVWDFGDNGEAFQTLQCSPADLTPYAVFASWHTTLNAAVSVGASTITVNASADTTNTLATQLAPGQSLVLSMGDSVHQETVTVQSVGATSPGWTTAVITLTTTTTHTHAIGDIVCEPLPTGVTDPTTWDAVSAFDATAFAY